MKFSLAHTIALLAIGAPLAHASCAHLTTLRPRSFKEPSFGYSDPIGPDVWHTLSPDNAVCGNGTHQSPIDIHSLELNKDLSADGVRTIAGSELKVDIPNLTQGAEFENLGTTIEVIANGTLTGSGLGVRKLAQFHFHTPSEHLVDGKAADMEAHFVFQSEEGNIAVVGFRLNTDATADSGLFHSVMEHTSEIQEPGSVTNTKSLSFDKLIAHLNTNEVMTYSGSLTTPPCSEGVTWLISAAPLSISAEDVAAANKLMGDNARPAQGGLGEENINAEDGDAASEEEAAVETVYETVYACPAATEAPSTMVTSNVPVNGTMTTMVAN